MDMDMDVGMNSSLFRETINNRACLCFSARLYVFPLVLRCTEQVAPGLGLVDAYQPPRWVFFFFSSGHYTTQTLTPPHTHWGVLGCVRATYLPNPPAGQDRMLNWTTIGERKKKKRSPNITGSFVFFCCGGVSYVRERASKIRDWSRLVSGKGFFVCLLTCLLACLFGW